MFGLSSDPAQAGPAVIDHVLIIIAANLESNGGEWAKKLVGQKLGALRTWFALSHIRAGFEPLAREPKFRNHHGRERRFVYEHAIGETIHTSRLKTGADNRLPLTVLRAPSFSPYRSMSSPRRRFALSPIRGSLRGRRDLTKNLVQFSGQREVGRCQASSGMSR